LQMKFLVKLMFGALAEPRFYSLFGIVMLLVASVFLMKGQFTVTDGDGKHVITRQHDATAYWGAEGAIVLIGVLLLAGGLYSERKSVR
jgi:hypothetical protein